MTKSTQGSSTSTKLVPYSSEVTGERIESKNIEVEDESHGATPAKKAGLPTSSVLKQSLVGP